MKQKKLISLMLAAVVASGAVLTGCGGSGTETTTAGTSQESQSAGQTEGSAAAVEYDDDATIVWGMTSQWADLTPFANTAGGYYSGIITSMIYDKLVYCTTDGTISPRAAESWELSDDGKTFTFKLNPDSKFHDGESVTAEDWVWTAKLLANPEAGFSDHSAAMTIIAGTDDTGAMISEEDFGFKALDDTTLSITLKNPMKESTFLISYSYYYAPLPKHLLENVPAAAIVENEFFTAPVGSGPCAFESLTAGSELVLKRFEDYPIGEAHYSKMVFRIMSGTALATALMTGEIDIPYVTLTMDEAKELEGSENLVVQTDEFSPNLWYMPINNQRIKDVRIRQAVNCAINKSLIAEQLLQGSAKPVETYLATDSAYVPDSITAGYDKDKAKELLDAAKADGYDGKLLIATPAGIRERICALVEQDLEAIGFDVEIQVLEASTMFADLRKGAEGTYDVGVVGRGVSPDPCYFDGDLDYRRASYFNVSEPEYVELQEKYVNSKTDEESIEAFHEYQEYIHQQMPGVFLVDAYNYLVYNKRLGDISLDYSTISLRNFGVWNWKVLKQ